jgi:hypothetical protein
MTAHDAYTPLRLDAMERQIRKQFWDMLENESEPGVPPEEPEDLTGMPHLLEEDLDEDKDLDETADQLDGEDIVEGAAAAIPANEDDIPDVFAPSQADFAANAGVKFSSQPPHLQVIYALVTWLRLQFHLSCTACHTVLAILACVLFFLNPSFEVPCVTLTSAN